MSVCKKCGRKIMDDDLECVVNEGLSGRFVTCESCHDGMWEDNEIIMCESCGEWFTPDTLKTETIYGNSFCSCPCCGKDIVNGMLREEYEEEYGPDDDASGEKNIAIVEDGNGKIHIFSKTFSDCPSVAEFDAFQAEMRGRADDLGGAVLAIFRESDVIEKP